MALSLHKELIRYCQIINELLKLHHLENHGLLRPVMVVKVITMLEKI